MSDEELLRNLRGMKCGYPDAAGNYECDYLGREAASRLESQQAEIERLERENKELRNFACQLCGKYKTEHLGSCDGCRWHRKG